MRVVLSATICDVAFKLVEQGYIVFANCIQKVRDEEFAGGAGGLGCAGAGVAGEVAEGAVGQVTVEQTLLEEAVERGHDGGVGERAVEVGEDVADRALSLAPKDVQDLGLEGSQVLRAPGTATGEEVGEHAHLSW